MPCISHTAVLRTGCSELARGWEVLHDQTVRVRGRHAEHQERFYLRNQQALIGH